MPGSVVALLETLVAVSEEVGVPQSRVDEYIGMALEVLPWVRSWSLYFFSPAYTPVLVPSGHFHIHTVVALYPGVSGWP